MNSTAKPFSTLGFSPQSFPYCGYWWCIDTKETNLKLKRRRQVDSRIFGAIIGFFIGSFLGGSMGVAAGGGAVNGAYVFGPIGAFIGYLLGQRKNVSKGNETYARTSRNANDKGPAGPEQAEELKENLTETANKAEWFFNAIVRLLCSFWNIQMGFLIRINVMPYFISMSWIFAVIGILLLAIALPIGVIFCLTAFAAMSREIKRENNFIVLKK